MIILPQTHTIISSGRRYKHPRAISSRGSTPRICSSTSASSSVKKCSQTARSKTYSIPTTHMTWLFWRVSSGRKHWLCWDTSSKRPSLLKHPTGHPITVSCSWAIRTCTLTCRTISLPSRRGWTFCNACRIRPWVSLVT